jgi:general secretion pathway protein J
MRQSKKKRKHCRTRQFTLLELVIATMLLLLIVATLYTAGSAVASSWERIRNESERFSEVLKLDRTLDGALANIVPFHWRDEEGRQINPFLGDTDKFWFVYQHRMNTVEQGALRFAHLRVHDDNLILYYQARPLLNEENWELAQQSILAKAVDSIELSYADWTPDDGVVWVDEWNVDDDRLDLPLAVAVRVHWLDGRWECWLRRTAGNGYRERWRTLKSSLQRDFKSAPR